MYMCVHYYVCAFQWLHIRRIVSKIDFADTVLVKAQRIYNSKELRNLPFLA